MEPLLALIDAGIITTRDALDVLNAQRSHRKPIGQLALEKRMLSVGQIFKVLARTADTQERFGQAAIALGFLTEEQVTSLLVWQQERLPTLSELLVEMGFCSLEEAQRLLPTP